jgi:hypothetical protein
MEGITSREELELRPGDCQLSGWQALGTARRQRVDVRDSVDEAKHISG